MTSRSVLVGLLFVSVVCAGCTSPSAPQSPAGTSVTDEPTPPTTTETNAETDATKRTTGATADCPYTLHVDVATDGQLARTDDVSDETALPSARQREFEAARANGSITLGETLPEMWAAPRIITDAGEQYYAVAQVC